jgi:hypothetical protein
MSGLQVAQSEGGRPKYGIGFPLLAEEKAPQDGARPAADRAPHVRLVIDFRLGALVRYGHDCRRLARGPADDRLSAHLRKPISERGRHILRSDAVLLAVAVEVRQAGHAASPTSPFGARRHGAAQDAATGSGVHRSARPIWSRPNHPGRRAGKGRCDGRGSFDAFCNSVDRRRTFVVWTWRPSGAGAARKAREGGGSPGRPRPPSFAPAPPGSRTRTAEDDDLENPEEGSHRTSTYGGGAGLGRPPPSRF